ncbi:MULTISPECIES: hypothetical protein [Bradyrhizobium]|jgi:hypothetical protein|uniref:Uncharacterized protein n=1 Tax=Bradyrhizobium elkanii TaxID=29448 RepID=A0A8I1Y6T5_BRAEL|nr:MULTISPECIES: hypothetical protein [Bradyrhizobium]MBP1294317.1 hypothetical protein [Bradyrhizobium elkanii]MCP1925294.1 hypothetical protein [Bradyrhizobium elkanii]MCS3477213.1 hypothetical protein [Bradyrhizobium elkanii]MCS3583950.1 hypothetical protein [Bradyrhizobium elkanii]MCS3717520.1 hypothetical protein [Bradyrhizobium elkanii]
MTDTSAGSSPTKVAPAYPAAGVASLMRDELLNAVRSTYKRKGLPLPPDDASVVAKPIEIDSQLVVETLQVLDDILPFKVTESVVKAGGYGSIEAAVAHVTGRVEKKWSEHHTGAKT